MTEELKEFRELVDLADSYRPGRGVPEPPDEETVTRCIQVMLARQCLYAGMHGLGPYYRVLSTPEYQGFFRKYFAAMGLEFHHDTRSGLVALRVASGAPRFDAQSQRLRKDETAVLLALRVAYEEAFNAKQFDDLGTVATTTDELYDKLAAIGGIEIPETRLLEILATLKRKGIVEIGERDPVERVRPLTILPGIEVAVPPAYIERVRMAAEAAPPAAAKDDAAESAGEPPHDAVDEERP
jgi:hypothetical protein